MPDQNNPNRAPNPADTPKPKAEDATGGRKNPTTGLTKRHYVWLASVIASARHRMDPDARALYDQVELAQIAHTLGEGNPEFNSVLFGQAVRGEK